MRALAPILFLSVILGQDEDIDLDTVNLDLDALWENTVWEEIQDVTDVYYEVERVTPVAGVRGAEAEDEALALLYYRKSMKGLTLIDLQRAYGKLKNKRGVIKDPEQLKKVDNLLLQLKIRMRRS
mgnify:FL=1|tara:strand:- start:4761 stop:5135 length:375 start_codon:yes stop_codon:yes gene_type:complete